jgi:hypothetical protein
MAALPRDIVDRIIAADGGSSNGTADIARRGAKSKNPARNRSSFFSDR